MWRESLWYEWDISYVGVWPKAIKGGGSENSDLVLWKNPQEVLKASEGFSWGEGGVVE